MRIISGKKGGEEQEKRLQANKKKNNSPLLFALEPRLSPLPIASRRVQVEEGGAGIATS